MSEYYRVQAIDTVPYLKHQALNCTVLKGFCQWDRILLVNVELIRSEQYTTVQYNLRDPIYGQQP